MANLTTDGALNGIGQEGIRFHVPTAVTGYVGGMVSIMPATGLLVPTTTAGAGPAIGKATHNYNATVGRVLVETKRIFRLTNGASPFTDATPIGSPVFAVDDNSVSTSDNGGLRQRCGVFYGLEATEPAVRVYMEPEQQISTPRVQTGSGTLIAGVLTVNTGITVTANSRIFCSRVTEAGTDGDELRVPTADRTVGGPGTGAIVIRSFLSGVAATSDTSTIEFMIVG